VHARSEVAAVRAWERVRLKASQAWRVALHRREGLSW
jgi:hypothetical protein